MRLIIALLASCILTIVIVLICFMMPLPLCATILFKSYVIYHDNKVDILCDPYFVQKDDYVTKIFRQRGEIAQKDFPEFLGIFKRINSGIRDINAIQPGQQIIIPLKKIEPDTFPGQTSGYVAIPFVTISSISAIIRSHSQLYKVKKGDCLSKIIAKHYGLYGSIGYKEGVKLFKAVNPEITNINIISAGKKLFVPKSSLRNEFWYQSLFDSSGNIILRENENYIDKSYKKADISPPVQKKKADYLETAALILNAKLINKGTYYFPRPYSNDFEFDFSKHTVFELHSGKRLILLKENSLNDSEVNTIKDFWKDVNLIKIPLKASAIQILDAVLEPFKADFSEDKLLLLDDGIKITIHTRWTVAQHSSNESNSKFICASFIDNQYMRIQASIISYLKQKNIIVKDIVANNSTSNENMEHKKGTAYFDDVVIIDRYYSNKKFVYDFLKAMGINYAQNVGVSFPYAGIQVDAVSNLITRKDQTKLLVDFEELYGDAYVAIKNTGIDVISIKSDDNYTDIMNKILHALKASYTNDPTFLAAKRPKNDNISITIPGFLIDRKNDSKILFSKVPLNNYLIAFLKEQNIKIIVLKLA